jgi:2,5-diketo-D-gluconate reductase A
MTVRDTVPTSAPTSVPTITLNDGTSIPQLGFGVFQVDPDETQRVVEQALEIGYRHLDTAQMYRNEEGVGRAIAASGLARDDLYVTTKLNKGFHEPDRARRAFDDSLARLGLDHVDLFLIHWPLPTLYGGDFETTWRTLAEFSAQWGDGRATSIGVSNFEPAHLQRIVEDSGHVPAVNQVEVHPNFGNEAVRAANASHGVATEAWSPIAQGAVLDDPTIGAIAQRLGRTPAQITLRWHVQRGDIVFPKSVNPERMRENFALFDFELTADDMSAITGLDRGAEGRQGADPTTMAWVPKD